MEKTISLMPLEAALLQKHMAEIEGLRQRTAAVQDNARNLALMIAQRAGEDIGKVRDVRIEGRNLVIVAADELT